MPGGTLGAFTGSSRDEDPGLRDVFRKLASRSLTPFEGLSMDPRLADLLGELSRSEAEIPEVDERWADEDDDDGCWGLKLLNCCCLFLGMPGSAGLQVPMAWRARRERGR